MRLSFFIFITLSLSLNAWDDSRIRGKTVPPTPYSVKQLYPGLKLDSIMAIFPYPLAPEQLVIAELNGRISLLQKDGQLQQIWKYANADKGTTKNQSEIVLYSIAFDPQSPRKPFLYIAYHVKKEATSKIIRVKIHEPQKPEADPTSELCLFKWKTKGHCGTELRFGPEDGLLYFATGDGSTPGDPDNIGQTVDNFLGSVLRIDVRKATASQPYKIPKDNPFVGMRGVRPEIWSYGLRNPFRMSFDPLSGQLLIGDNGDESWEYAFLTHKGANHGWSVYEGSHPFKTHLKIGGPTKTITPPVIERSHVDTRSIIGGYVYQDSVFPELKNHYLFADYVTGLIWAAPWNGKIAGEHVKIAALQDRPLCISRDNKGNILIATFTGKIWSLTKNKVHESILPYPLKLSETGLFSSTAKHQPAAGIIAYKINAESWRDGALTKKFFALPEGASLYINENGECELPDGGVIFQTISLPVKTATSSKLQRVETQLIHREGKLYNFRTYKWNNAQSDAELVNDDGEYREIPIENNKTLSWHFTSTNQCLTCHSSKTPSFTLGFNAAQLNTSGQISDWQAQGLMKAHKFWQKDIPVRVNPLATDASLESRALSYLDINCSHCHQRGGIGGRANFSLSKKLDLTAMKLILEKPQIPLFTGTAGHLITPGKPEKSEIYRRLAIRGPGQMPLFGSSIIDNEGIKLINQWIKSLNSK